MSAQKQVEPQPRQEVEEQDSEAKDLRNPKLSDDIDAILDDIDDVLETNAEEFVNAYVQKGGE